MKKRLLSLVLILCMMLATVLTGCNASDDKSDKEDKKDKKDKKSDSDVVAEYKYDDDNIFGLKKIIVGKDKIELQFDSDKADEGYAFLSGYGDDVKSLNGTGTLKDKKDEEVEAEFKCKEQGSKYIITASYEEGFVPDYFYFRETEIDGFKKPDLFYRMWGGECADTFSQSYDGKEWSDVEEGFESYPETCGEEDYEEYEEFSENSSIKSYFSKDWQSAYKSVLDNYRNLRSGGHEVFESEAEDIYGYWLYDIDCNSTPELIIRFGNCEANFHDLVYTSVDGEALEVGELPGGHTCYYGKPDDGIVSIWGHMGCQAMYIVKLSDDMELSMESVFEEDINGDPEADYTPVSEIVPGAYYKTMYCYCLDLPLLAVTKLVSTADPILDNAEVEAVFFNTVNSNGLVYASQIEHFREPLPEMDFETFLEGGNIDEFSDEKDAVTEMEYADLNSDGQNEAIIKTKYDNVVILSYQNGKVYAYVSNYNRASDMVGIEDWFLKFSTDYSDFKVSLTFFQDQVYEEYVYN